MIVAEQLRKTFPGRGKDKTPVVAVDQVGFTAHDGETEVGEEGDRCFEVADGDADVLKSDGHAPACYRHRPIRQGAGLERSGLPAGRSQLSAGSAAMSER